MRVLFISHNGLSEPLGQSQVLAYLRALVPKGHDFDLVTFEPKRWDGTPGKGIHHHPIVRTPGSRLSAKLHDMAQGVLIGRRLLAQGKIDLIHARSLLPAAMADAIRSQAPDTPILFDLPGFLPQEYLDAGHWSKGDFRYEIAQATQDLLIQRVEALAVGTTHAVTQVMDLLDPSSPKPAIEIIPSCVDTNLFRLDQEARRKTRARLRVERGPVVVYSGSLGSWYLHEEMLRLFEAILARHPDALFAVATRSNPAALLDAAERLGIRHRTSVFRLNPEQMPEFLAGADIGLCFVAPAPSKKASSPVKLAEYLACGVPTIVNAGVGDMEEHASKCPGVMLLEDFSERTLAQTAAGLDELMTDETKRACRAYTVETFDLHTVAADRYDRLYRKAERRE